MKLTKINLTVAVIVTQICSFVVAQQPTQVPVWDQEQIELLLSGEIEAPVNPEFTAWRERQLNSTFGEYNQGSYTSSYIPSPFDMSYLKEQKVSSINLFANLPSRYDLRDDGYVTSVQDQGRCGACWAFATLGSLESWLLRHEGREWDFSENHMKNYHGFDFTPCGGGNHYVSTAYLTRWSGPVNELDDPFTDSDDRPSNGGQSQKIVKTMMEFFSPEEIKNALVTYGALHSTMYIDQQLVDPVNYTYYYDGNEPINHGITIVGWDDNMSVPQAPGPGAWIVKNSWSRAFGENGYFYISYFDSKAVNFAAAFCDAVPATEYKTNYQYDPLGKVSAVGYGRQGAWGANIFTAESDELLSAVGFYMLGRYSTYEIRICDSWNIMHLVEGDQVLDLVYFSDLLASVSGSVTYSGYYTIDLSYPVEIPQGDDFIVVVKFVTPGYNYPVAVEYARAGYSSAATVNPGESFVSPDGQYFIDLTLGEPSFNVCIKCLTLPQDEEVVDPNSNAAYTEGFEESRFGDSWGTYGDGRWCVTSEESNTGHYSATAGYVRNNQLAGLRFVNDCENGEISFYTKVSSEENFDFLKFYIDGVEKGRWSGQQDWEKVTFPINEGTRTFKWEYSKDGSASSGEDTGYIDDVEIVYSGD